MNGLWSVVGCAINFRGIHGRRCTYCVQSRSRARADGLWIERHIRDMRVKAESFMHITSHPHIPDCDTREHIQSNTILFDIYIRVILSSLIYTLYVLSRLSVTIRDARVCMKLYHEQNQYNIVVVAFRMQPYSNVTFERGSMSFVTSLHYVPQQLGCITKIRQKRIVEVGKCTVSRGTATWFEQRRLLLAHSYACKHMFDHCKVFSDKGMEWW